MITYQQKVRSMGGAKNRVPQGDKPHQNKKKDACYDRDSTFRLKRFLKRRGPLTQNRRKIRPISFCMMVLVVHLGHGIFHSVLAAVLFFPKLVFLGEEVSSSQIKG